MRDLNVTAAVDTFLGAYLFPIRRGGEREEKPERLRNPAKPFGSEVIGKAPETVREELALAGRFFSLNRLTSGRRL